MYNFSLCVLLPIDRSADILPICDKSVTTQN